MLTPIRLQSPCWRGLPSTPWKAPQAYTWANACAVPCFRLLTLAQRESGSHLIIPRSAQFTNRFPTIVEPRNHSSPLRNAEGVPYPMEVVGDLALEDKIFPGIPGDSLLFDGTKLARLWQKNYSLPMHLPLVSHTGYSSNVASGGMPSHSTFESDAEALSQGVAPPVTPPTTP